MNTLPLCFAEINDKHEKIIEKQIQPMSFQITEISSKQIENIQNGVIPIIPEHQSSDYKFERNFQYNISPSNQGFEQPEEEMIEFRNQTISHQNKFKIKLSL